MLWLLSLLLIMMVCLLAGWLYERKIVKSFLSFIEDNLLIFIPGYAMLKSSADAGIEGSDENWKTVIVREEDDLTYGIEVDRRTDGFSIIFFPEPPDAKSGDMRLMQESKFQRTDFPVNKLVKIIRNYGHGSVEIPKNSS
jgi:uncharacterized membrane protein